MQIRWGSEPGHGGLSAEGGDGSIVHYSTTWVDIDQGREGNGRV